MFKKGTICWSLLIVSLYPNIWSTDCAIAQITPDSTLPNNSRVTTLNNLNFIEGGTQAGHNLFHSFQQFSVPTRSGAFFNNAVDIQNIITRVTGGSISNIDGLIAANGKANFFLINPSGIVFGPNASLNVGGSFLATTANSLQFGSQGFFSASNPETPSPLLTINPSALLFNQLPIAQITNLSQAPAGVNPVGSNTNGLRVADGNSLILVGGNVNLDGGSLRAYGGRVEIAGLASPGSVGLNIAGNTFSLNVPNDAQRADVSLSNQAAISVFGDGAGDIAINARNLDISDSLLFGGIGAGLGTADTLAGDILLNATGTITLKQGSLVSNEIDSNAFGNGGNIKINAGSLTVESGAGLSSAVSGQGNGGNIIINASDRVSFDGSNNDTLSRAVTTVQSDGVGKAGNIEVTTGAFSLKNGAYFSSSILGNGTGGNITINARNTVAFDGSSYASSDVFSGGVGKGGDIKVTTGSLSLTNGSQLDTSVSGQGEAGNITIDARDTVNLDGIVGTSISGVQSELLTGGVGKGGNIQITTGSLSATNGAQVSTSTDGRGNAGNITLNARDTITFDGVGIKDVLGSNANSTLASNGIGNGGNIRVSTRALFLKNGGQLNANNFGQGNGGNITIDARNTVEFDGAGSKNPTGAYTTVNSSAVGNAGNINVTTGSLFLNNGAQINAATLGQGNAGDISLNARDAITFNGTGSNGFSSGVFSEVETGGVGKGGNLSLKTGSLTLTKGGEILASSFGKGDGGNITINARDTAVLDGIGSNGVFSGVYSAVGNGGVGRGGDIQFTSGFIRLNQAVISALTVSGKGGDISLEARNALVLRHGSQITTSAGVEQTGGDGGNITINTPFVVAVPQENSDITANAFTGAGGIVNMNATGIFSITPKSREELTQELGTSDRALLDPQRLPTNDITAISQDNPSLNGLVTINAPEIDPARGLVELPIDIIDASSKLIASSCRAFADDGGSKFTVTGRGGLAASPYDPLTGEAIWSDTRLPATLTEHQGKIHATKPEHKSKQQAIVPATGWVFNGNGEVTLISSVSEASDLGSTPTSCPAH